MCISKKQKYIAYFAENGYEGDDNGKILILSVAENEEDILEKILKVVGVSADVEERMISSEKIERADLQILLPEKLVYRGGKEILLNRHEFDTLVYLDTIQRTNLRCGLDRRSHGL